MTTTTFRGFTIYSLNISTINVDAFYSEILFFKKNHKFISKFLKYITIQVFTEYCCLKNCSWVKLIISTLPCNFLACASMASKTTSVWGSTPGTVIPHSPNFLTFSANWKSPRTSAMEQGPLCKVPVAHWYASHPELRYWFRDRIGRHDNHSHWSFQEQFSLK